MTEYEAAQKELLEHLTFLHTAPPADTFSSLIVRMQLRERIAELRKVQP